MSENPVVSYGKFVVNRPWLVLLVSLIVVFSAGYGLKNIYFSSDYRVFFGEDNPQLAAQDDLERTYTKVDTVSIILKPKDGDVYNKDFLNLVHEYSERAWQVPYSIRVDSITNYQHTKSEEDDMIVEDLVEDPDSLDRQRLDLIRQVTLSEPSLINRLISQDGTATQIVITVETPDSSGSTLEKIVGPVRQMADDIRANHPDVHVALAGVVMLSNAFSEAAQHDMTTLFPLMYLLLALTIFMFLRSFLGMLSTMMVVFFSVITGVGIAGHLGWGLTSASVNSFVTIAKTIILIAIT